MNSHRLDLVVLPGRYAVCRLPPSASVPTWATTASFSSITRTGEELSIVCAEEAVPADVHSERGWRCLRVAGTLDFGMVGVLAALLTPLATAAVSVFALSTFDTDYLLVREGDLGRAIDALRGAGHTVSVADSTNTQGGSEIPF